MYIYIYTEIELNKILHIFIMMPTLLVLYIMFYFAQLTNFQNSLDRFAVPKHVGKHVKTYGLQEGLPWT